MSKSYYRTLMTQNTQIYADSLIKKYGLRKSALCLLILRSLI